MYSPSGRFDPVGPRSYARNRARVVRGCFRRQLERDRDEVFVVNGHPTTRIGLMVLLGDADLRVVGESGDGEEVLRILEGERPDLWTGVAE
jgi:hypothetical protein